MKIDYTDSGRLALEVFKGNQAKELEEYICSKKYVFGDDAVEITAADVKEAAAFRSLGASLRRRRSSVEIVARFYMVIGILVAAVGLFYDRLVGMFRDNPTQLMLVVCGVAVSLASSVMISWSRMRQREAEKTEMIEKSKFETIEKCKL